MLSTLKDGIDNVVIQFDAPEPVFQAGKTITGEWKQRERVAYWDFHIYYDAAAEGAKKRSCI